MPAQGKIAWDNLEAYQKLVAAIIATDVKVSSTLSSPPHHITISRLHILPSSLRILTCLLRSQIDIRAIAHYYGTTYDTLENRFRPLKKMAAQLKADASDDMRSTKPATPRKPKTQMPKKGDVLASMCSSYLSSSLC
jgi:hypothetical protein